ncbi:hypothetical protein BPOR_0161g00070 [Botrytis porri]|uniref:Uncharacterized protein n=1 Tax=Botrytis porri TaxID=87229 RepID=A0A4Z1KVJ9_9HELO|nr:hypothetical protein BPOR_0161g00070 [Botrytis porri]
MDTNLNSNTSMLQTASANVQASTVGNNETTTITTAAMENQNQGAATSSQPPTPSASTTMSNITPTTSTTTTIPPPTPSTSTTMSNITPMVSILTTIPPSGRLSTTLPLELRLAIYKPLLCMTIAGRLPPILYALHGTSDYSIVQAQYRIINFILSDATMRVFSTITRRGNRLGKLHYLHVRSDNFTLYGPNGVNNDSRNLVVRHYCKLQNSFRKVTFTAVQQARTPHTTESELDEANFNASYILHQLCEIVVASVQTADLRLKFLGYNMGNSIDQRRMNGFVRLASSTLAVSGRIWTPRRELVGDDGVVHDGIVWIWKLV